MEEEIFMEEEEYEDSYSVIIFNEKQDNILSFDELLIKEQEEQEEQDKICSIFYKINEYSKKCSIELNVGNLTDFLNFINGN